MPNLRLTSQHRTERLTDRETVRLGRLLMHALPTSHLSFPDDTPIVVVIAHDHGLRLAPGVRAKVVEVLGEFTEEVEQA